MKRRVYMGQTTCNLSRPGSTTDKRASSVDTIYDDETDDWRIYTLITIVAIVVYINGLPGDFVHDDIPAITMNKDVLGLSPLGNVFRNDFWGTPMADVNSHKSYRPLTTLTFR